MLHLANNQKGGGGGESDDYKYTMVINNCSATSKVLGICVCVCFHSSSIILMANFICSSLFVKSPEQLKIA